MKTNLQVTNETASGWIYMGLTYQDRIMKPTITRFLISAALFDGFLEAEVSFFWPKTHSIESWYSFVVISNSVSVSVSDDY